MSWSAPRTWVSGEVVTGAQLNTNIRDNLKVGRGFQRVVRTAGTLTFNSTAWANSSTTLDLTLAASTGDVVRADLNGLWGNNAVAGHLNVTCVASGAGFSTRTANTDGGCMGWFGQSARFVDVSGAPITRVLASADISGGNVIVRLRHRTGTAANKTINGSTANPLFLSARNVGPHVAP